MFSRGYKSLILKRKKFSNVFKDLAERCKGLETVCEEPEESIYTVEQSVECRGPSPYSVVIRESRVL